MSPQSARFTPGTPQQIEGRVVAILQARMSSRRLPGKVMLPLAGRPMLLRQVERLRRSRRISALIIATSDARDDDTIAQTCATEGVLCFRGSLTDVLDRYHAAAEFAGPTGHIVRVTADCPLTDPTIIDACIELHLRSGADYTSNTIERHYPKGLDVEVMTRAALKSAWSAATSDYDREHVTPYLYQHPDRFKLAQLTSSLRRGQWRWTVDTADDMIVVEAIYAALYHSNPAFQTEDVAAFLTANPDIARINGALS